LRREGTVLVTRAQEIVEVMGRMGELADQPEHPVTPLDRLSGVQQLIYEALPARGTRTVDEIARDAGVPAAQVLGPLAMLEIDGMVERHEGQWRLAKARRAG
jgi:DNA processing protein